MVLTASQQTTRDLTQSVENAGLAPKVLGRNYNPGTKQLITLDTVRASMDKLSIDDLQNIVAPILLDKVFATEFTTFQSNNPWSRFYRSTREFGKIKEHIITLSGTMVNLTGDTAGDMGNTEMSTGYKGKDENPSTLDWFESKDIAYYTKHVRAFVMVASINFTEIKGAFDSQGAWDAFTSRKTEMLMEQARQEESAVIAGKLAGLMLPQNTGLTFDDGETPKQIQPKITLMSDDFEQKDFVKYLQTYVNNIKFPELAKAENPLGLPLITKAERMVSYITPDIIASQNFLEAYAFTANKVTLPSTTEMMAPLPPVQLKNAKIDLIGDVKGLNPDGTFTGTVVPIAFIGDEEILDVVHSQLYTDTEVNKLREFFSAQVHDHLHVHPSYEKNVRFFAVPVAKTPVPEATLIAPESIATTPATDAKTADGTATIPKELKTSKGATVSVTSVITDSSQAVQPDASKLKSGNYSVKFSSAGYADVSKAFTIATK